MDGTTDGAGSSLDRVAQGVFAAALVAVSFSAVADVDDVLSYGAPCTGDPSRVAARYAAALALPGKSLVGQRITGERADRWLVLGDAVVRGEVVAGALAVLFDEQGGAVGVTRGNRVGNGFVLVPHLLALAGLLPPQFELATVYTAALATRALNPSDAAAFMALMASDEAAPLRAAGGFTS